MARWCGAARGAALLGLLSELIFDWVSFSAESVTAVKSIELGAANQRHVTSRNIIHFDLNYVFVMHVVSLDAPSSALRH